MNMKIKARSIISVLLILSMVFTVAAFTSCGSGEKEETITVDVSVTGSNGEVMENPLQMVGFPSDLTVLAATKRFCVEVYQIDFKYDETLNAVVTIGPDTLDPNAIKEAAGEEVTSETAEGDTTEATTANDGTYYDWQGYLNGVVTDPLAKIKEGDKIEWKWEKFQPTVNK